MNNSQPSQQQARPMPRVVPMLGIAAGVCVGFGLMMATGSVVLSLNSAAAPLGMQVQAAPQPAPAPTATVAQQLAENVRLMPIVEPLAADMDYFRSVKRAAAAAVSAPAPATAGTVRAAAPAAAEPAARDPKTAAAIKALEAQLERQPDSLETLNQLIGTISAQPPQAALGDLLRLYQAYPRQHVLAAQLGYTYSRVNDQDSALRYQQWAMTMAPNNPVYQFNVAVLQDRLGKREDAVRNYQQVLLRSNAGGPPVPTAAIRERLEYLARH